MTHDDAVDALFASWHEYRRLFTRIVRGARERGEDLPRFHWIDMEGWNFHFHGVGVRVADTNGATYINFDFDKPDPDYQRLRFFLVDQYKAGNLTKRFYRPLMQDKALFERIFENRLQVHVPVAE